MLPAACAGLAHCASQEFSLIPQFISSDGRIGNDCLELTGGSPRFSLKKLSLFLTKPSLYGEFMPNCPWEGVQLIRRKIPWPEKTSTVVDLKACFTKSVQACIGDARVVAVLFSGGLDSTAVLLHADAICRRLGLKLIAITADLVSDRHSRAVNVAKQLIEALEIRCDLGLVSSDTKEDLPFPTWSPIGPRLDAMPRLNRAMNDLARDMGAEVVLTGSGADELLGSGRFLLRNFLRSGRFRGAWSYLKYVAEGGWVGLVLEGLGLLPALLPRRLVAPLYWAINWKDLIFNEAASLLAEPYRSYAIDWSETWVRDQLRLHPALTGDWAVADAWDSLFPHDLHLPAGSLDEHSPFLTPLFLQTAMRIPLDRRFEEAGTSSYHRRKALVMALIDPRFHGRLPDRKEIFSGAFQSYQEGAASDCRRAVELGLFDPCVVVGARRDAVLLHVAASIEAWIIGAETFGATPVA